MRLRLVQLPANPAYGLAAAVQELVRRQFLHAKASNAHTLLSMYVQPPPPTIIAFTPTPTYTLGRRQSLELLTDDERARLQAPLESLGANYAPAIEESARGGLTTYHGPGQAVIWPVIDLKAPQFQNYGALTPLTVRAYSRLLETTTQDVLKRRFGLDVYTTDEPGLWIQSPRRRASNQREPNQADVDSAKTEKTEKIEKIEETEERKIAALGVHLRRNISALGVAVNLDTPVTRAPATNNTASPSNPWKRFVPCGIEGKGVSCVADEARLRFGGHVPESWDLSAASFASKWAAAFAQRLGLAEMEVDIADAETVRQLVAHAEELLSVD
ncbi:biotin lipoate a b protein ligase [Ophiostoma piceae UAMH 11346]|uniref:Biotin lipoate a b protein ligase n=1 Tax=Ophiostoma piceae (strain UAMH 11346) TaxID=1262450 RepID=S3C0W8_OPHP1|nr:biotin lipoate a b protein ligase [Ophiostoma piceae UAMH 11346]